MRCLTLHSMVPAIAKTVDCEWWSAVELKLETRSPGSHSLLEMCSDVIFQIKKVFLSWS